MIISGSWFQVSGCGLEQTWIKMATIHKFEDLEVWQKARALAQDIYSKTMNDSFTLDNDLK